MVVHLHLAGEQTSLPARIVDHDVEGDAIIVSAPGGRGQGRIIAESGDKVSLTWVVPSGIGRLETSFLDWSGNPPTMWRLALVSDVSVVERRRHPRVPMRQDLHLILGDLRIPATMMDVSEGGMRCLVDTVQPAALSRDLVSTLSIGGRAVGVHGGVAWSKHHGGHVEVGVSFASLKRGDAEVIRHSVRRVLAASA